MRSINIINMLQIASPKSIQKLHLLYVMYVNLNISCFAGFANIGVFISVCSGIYIIYVYLVLVESKVQCELLCISDL